MELRSTQNGPRLRWQPVKEWASLRAQSWQAGRRKLQSDSANPLADASGELLEVRADFRPAADSSITFQVRGIDVTYNAAKQEIVIGNHHAHAPLVDGVQKLIIIADRTMLTIWASDGLTYIPFPVIPRPTDVGVKMSVKGGEVSLKILKPIV